MSRDQTVALQIIVQDNQVTVRNADGTNEKSCSRRNPVMEARTEAISVDKEVKLSAQNFSRRISDAMRDFSSIFGEDNFAYFTKIGPKLRDDVVPAAETASLLTTREVSFSPSSYIYLDSPEMEPALRRRDGYIEDVNAVLAALRALRDAALLDDQVAYDQAEDDLTRVRRQLASYI